MNSGRVLLVVVSTAVFGLFTTAPAVAQPSTTSEPVPAAAGWLARQMVDGNHLETVFDGTAYADAGLTADAVLAFDAADVAQQYAAAAAEWLGSADVLPGYIGDGTAESYPGALAKVALVAMAQGGDPAAFGGVDLITRLKDRQADSGRFSDASQFGDFSNVITQSLAILALQRDGQTVTSAVGFLVDSQCADGGFPLQFDQSTCGSEVDATAFAVQALLAAGRDPRDSDVARALDYLVGEQRPGGGFGGSGPTGGTNANSTGLAAQALRLGGRKTAAKAAVRHLLSLQVGCDGPADQRGGIAYDSSGFDPATATRATAQALYGLTGVDLLGVANDGDAAAAPTLDCPVPTTTTTPSPSSTTTTTAPVASSAAVVTTTTLASSAAVAARRTGGGADELPATGVQPAQLLVVGAMLLISGVALVLLGRRRLPAGEPRRRSDAQ